VLVKTGRPLGGGEGRAVLRAALGAGFLLSVGVAAVVFVVERDASPVGGSAGEAFIIAAFLIALSVALLLGHVVSLAGRAERRADRAETATRDNALGRDRFRDFAESASDWFWETDPDHRYTLISERVALILGGDPARVFGKSLLELERLVEDPEVWREALDDIRAGRAFRDLEIVWIDDAEKTFVCRVSGRPVFDAQGAFAGYRGSGVDVTVDTLALMEARVTREVVQDALDSISEGFVLFSSDGRLLFCNDQYRKAYPNIADLLLPGITFAEILRTAADRSNIEEARENIGSWIQERIERHLGKASPADRFLSNGRWYRISEHATPSGGIVKLLTDITELKEREQELAGHIVAATENETLYRQLFELAPYGVVFWDGDCVRFSNSSAAAIVGAAEGEALVGRRLADFLEDGAATEDKLMGAAESEIRRVPRTVIQSSGERRDVELSAFPAVFRKEPTVLLFIDDVTDRKRVEEELQRSQKMEAVGRMAGGVAHEFNNLLTAIGGFARLAEREPGDAERVVTCVREIAKASDRAAALTGQLLDFSRRRVTEEATITRLGDVVEDLRVFLKPLMSAGVDLSVEVRAPDLHAVVNPVTLNQAVLNLAINGRDAMPNGGRLSIVLDEFVPDATLLARHEQLKSGRCAVISVGDTGTGIPDEIRDRIWEPFFTTKELGKGTGLGLSMVYGAASQVGGMADFTTELGVGTTFRIILPVCDPPADSDEEMVGGLSPDDGSALNVLLVDDEDAVRAYLKLVLEEAGCHIVEARDGQDAVEKFDEAGGLFDLVVTDVAMPRMNGADLARALSERNPYLRMLFLTGFASRDLASSLTGRDEWRLLMKPVAPNDLMRAIRDLVGTEAE